mmetsp:Transcript_82546/g.164600  ORF Transcript_82546/g.164600 Transcript_82546/m.164600 type:complete len:82 (-) Transcript_82546:636-881(-)
MRVKVVQATGERALCCQGSLKYLLAHLLAYLLDLLACLGRRLQPVCVCSVSIPRLHFNHPEHLHLPKRHVFFIQRTCLWSS